MSNDDAIVVRNSRSTTPMLIMRPLPDGRIYIVGDGWTMTEACEEFIKMCKKLQLEAKGLRGNEA